MRLCLVCLSTLMRVLEGSLHKGLHASLHTCARDLHDNFNLLDTDNDGHLSRGELAVLLHSQHVKGKGSMFVGFYDDPNHSGCPRSVNVTASGLVVYGTDETGPAWSVPAEGGKTPDDITVDFTAKGGPKISGNLTDTGIVWADGNAWTRTDGRKTMCKRPLHITLEPFAVPPAVGSGATIPAVAGAVASSATLRADVVASAAPLGVATTVSGGVNSVATEGIATAIPVGITTSNSAIATVATTASAKLASGPMAAVSGCQANVIVMAAAHAILMGRAAAHIPATIHHVVDTAGIPLHAMAMVSATLTRRPTGCVTVMLATVAKIALRPCFLPPAPLPECPHRRQELIASAATIGIPSTTTLAITGSLAAAAAAALAAAAA
eukprot:CAMPEP_0119306216 /NCGR_PEP_ID=MMETSP1333-20130426/7018_1 /TAXON_ID=418940 /ORGANISM="Scyphosphaera apsteinii, Strain RCC1455" /LENGTH=380 /DNA_ID=CAMNT_0007309463 /DNA_START=30 /DNA_END=1171 /DNA_ORIENTATION=+